jgi:hypothetical protein
MSRFQQMFDESIEGSGYRISPRMPLRYRVARYLQRMFKEDSNITISLGTAETLGGMLQLSVNIGFPMTAEFYRYLDDEKHTRIVTRMRVFPNGGSSIVDYKETLPHHPMRLRSHARREAEEAVEAAESNEATEAAT